MIDKSNFFYASDLAQLYNISKQTLIFYDKKDLFKPDYVDSNGYRMYSRKFDSCKSKKTLKAA